MNPLEELQTVFLIPSFTLKLSYVVLIRFYRIFFFSHLQITMHFASILPDISLHCLLLCRIHHPLNALFIEYQNKLHHSFIFYIISCITKWFLFHAWASSSVIQARYGKRKLKMNLLKKFYLIFCLFFSSISLCFSYACW